MEGVIASATYCTQTLTSITSPRWEVISGVSQIQERAGSLGIFLNLSPELRVGPGVPAGKWVPFNQKIFGRRRRGVVYEMLCMCEDEMEWWDVWMLYSHFMILFMDFRKIWLGYNYRGVLTLRFPVLALIGLRSDICKMRSRNMWPVTIGAEGKEIFPGSKNFLGILGFLFMYIC